MESAAILVVGDEILSGEIADRNGPLALRVLSEAGVRVERLVTAPDREEVIAEELRRLRGAADAVIVSGGIGPTHDDVTRPAVARTLGLDLVVHPEAERRIRGYYADRVTESELAMARIPVGASLLDGEKTGTFGFAVGGVFVLPGVPLLFGDLLRPLTGAFRRLPMHRAELRTRRREGEIAPHLAQAQGACADVAIGSYPVLENGVWHVRVVLRCADPDRLAQVAARVRPHLG